MPTTKHVANTPIVEITVDGDFTRADVDKAAAERNTVTAQQDRVRVLEITNDLGKIEPSAWWEELSFGPKYWGKCSAVADLFIHAEVRFFPIAELHAAGR